MEGKKKLGLATVASIFFVFVAALTVHLMTPAHQIKTDGKFLSFGKRNAPIEVVLIEDFQCKNCRAFSKNIIPKLQDSYVNSGKVRFTLVPISFLRGSQMVGNAALEVYKQNPNWFFNYLKLVLEYEGEVKKGDLMRMAMRIRGIDLAKLERCIDSGCHNKELNENLDWAQKMMGAQFRTPALYVNGDVGSTYSFEAIQYQIELILGGQ